MKNSNNAPKYGRTRSFLTAKTLIIAGFVVMLALGISSLALDTRLAATQELDKTPISSEFPAGDMSFSSLEAAIASVRKDNQRAEPTAQTKLLPGDGIEDAEFGHNVAISGDTAIVSASAEPVDPTPFGAVYVFVRNGSTWTQQQKIVNPDYEPKFASTDFGTSVAISGNTLVIGNPTARVGGVFLGSYFIYTRTGTTWSLQQRINEPSRDTRSGYAQSAAIVDGRIFIGDPSDGISSGCVYVYSMTGTQQQKITASDGTSTDFFGYSLAILGDRLVIGANLAGGPGTNPGPGAAYVFELVEGTWTQRQKLIANGGSVGDSFGHSVAISADAIVVGANTSNSGRGSAYVFVRNEGSWVFEQRLTAPGGQAGDNFGAGVVIIENRVIVGMPGLVSKTAGGSIYIFDRCAPIGTNPTRVQAFDTSGGDDFGLSLAFSDNSLLVGGDDQAYIIPRSDFARPAGAAQCESEIIVNITTDEEDFSLDDDFCDVDMNQSGRQCSLRAAIQTATDLPGPDTISFDIPGGGIHTISPATNLPDITSLTTLDATTQPGYVNKPRIQINGLGGGSIGLKLAGSGNTVKAIAINRCGTGIRIEGNTNTVTGVHLGIDADGATIPPEGSRQGTGVEISGQNNTVLGDRNATNGETNSNITGNDLRGVYITGLGATGNRVSGVDFGFANGKTIEEEITGEQISIEQGSNNIIGGTTPAEVNLIANSGQTCVNLDDGASNNFVKSNALTQCETAVFIGEANNNQIGGTRDAGERNYITASEIAVQVGYPQNSIPPFDPALGNKVYGNVIGINERDIFAANDFGIIVGVARNTEIGTGNFGQHNFIAGSILEGIVITKEATETKVRGNFIGTDITGTQILANRDGVQVHGNNNEITNNIISGNNRDGIAVERFDEKDPIPSGNLIDNNRIGLKGDGTVAIPNDESGILLDGTNNTVTNNVISGNTRYGIDVRRNGNTIRANKIGTNNEGDSARANGEGGIFISSSSNTIEANVVSGNTGPGIVIARDAAVSPTPPASNIVHGNFIGTNAAGTSAIANSLVGIALADGANNNFIGGTTANTRNVISGNTLDGINIQIGVAVGAVAPYQNKIQGNYVGTNTAGTAAVPNGRNGILILGATTTLIGGITTAIPAGRNIISGNGLNGISLAEGATLNRISGNYVGTKADGTCSLGNGERGIRIGVSTSGTIVGGPEANAGNSIGCNGSNGISLTSDAGNNNLIDPNRIFGNVLAGIDIGENGFSPNDPADADVGPNKLQNFPTMTLSIVGGNLIVNYQVDSAPAHSTYGGPGIYVEFFEADATGAGRDFLGSDHYLLSDYTNGTPGTRQKNLGNAVSLGIAAGDLLTATATDAEGNSSEFTPAVIAPGGAPGFEGDVAPRPEGDGVMLSTDITQLRRFVSGLDVPGTTTNEIQRADCAPRTTFGDGVLTSSDVVQGRRYVAGLDPSTPSGGPASRSFISESSLTGDLSSFLFTREIRVGQSTTQPNHKVSVPIEMIANGNETAMSFTIEYDASMLTNPRVSLGKFAPPGSTLTFNTNQSGRIGILIDSAESMSASAIAMSIMSVTFDVVEKADKETAISLTSGLAAQGVSDSSAKSLPVTYRNGVVKIAGNPDR